MEWKAIIGYPGYKVSDEGQVYSMKSNRLLTISDHDNGYKTVALCRDGKTKRPFVHRLVYEAFVGAIPERYEINHKDENPSNNHLDNLEALTHWENMLYGTRNQRISRGNKVWRKVRGRAVLQYTLDGVLVKQWDSMADAHENGFHKSGISDCCNGRKKTYKGYLWEHADRAC